MGTAVAVNAAESAAPATHVGAGNLPALNTGAGAGAKAHGGAAVEGKSDGGEAAVGKGAAERTLAAEAALKQPALDRARLPQHVAIIMDGNGRWARRQGLPRFAGHRAGAKTVRTVVEECARLGLKQLTLYSFSTENWNRPADEVALLMDLYVEYMRSQRALLMENNIQFAQIGRREGLPEKVLEELRITLETTKANTGMTLCLAINYGSRGEITDAVRRIAEGVRRGEILPEAIDEKMIGGQLYTAGMPDPDLLIRTAGEMRISNYLLWQISYAEFYVTEKYWPEFGVEELHRAFENYAGRNRRFGGVDASNA